MASDRRTLVDIRLASSDDVGALAGLRRAWVEEQHGGPVDDAGFGDDFKAWMLREAHQRVTWLAETEGTVIGMVNLRVFERMPRPGRPTSRWGYLSNFFVRAEHRGQGVGGALLEACVRYGDEHGFVRIVLSPSELSVPLYLRLGFEPAASLLLRPASPAAGS